MVSWTNRCRRVGPRTAKALEEAFGLRTVGDLLRHYPRRYYTRGELTDLASLRDGEHVTVLAQVAHVRPAGCGTRRGTAARGDGHRRPRPGWR